MLTQPRWRSPLALLLVVLGGVLMFLAAEVPAGIAVLALGLAIEAIGIRLEHQAPHPPKQTPPR